MKFWLLLSALVFSWCPSLGQINCTGHGTQEQEDNCRCPFRDEDPCECTLLRNANGALVNYTIACYGANENQFPLMMNKIRDARLPVHTLFLNRCNVTLPRADIFRSLPFVSIQVIRSNVSPPGGQSPDTFLPILGGLEKSVRWVNFRESGVQGVDATSCALGALSELETLTIADAGLTHIPKDFFCCSYLNLEAVYLYNNSIPAMTRGALSRAERLRVFNANGNKITVMDRQFFPDPADKLEEIHLRRNQIQVLPKDIFSNMSSLRLVDLSHNKISFLPANTWTVFWKKLPDIYLDGNQLVCECNLDWLARLEHDFTRKQRWSRFLTGECTAPNHNFTALLDNLDVTDIVCG